MAFALDFPPDLVEAIARRAAELLREQHHPQVPDYLATGEAADYLRCKPQRVFDLVSQGAAPGLQRRKPEPVSPRRPRRLPER